MYAIARWPGKLALCRTPGILTKPQKPLNLPHDYLHKMALSTATLWLSELDGDEHYAFLCDGICNGLKLLEIGTSFSDVDMDNYKSATCPVNRHMVEQTIRDEIAQGNYVVSAVKIRIVSA